MIITQSCKYSIHLYKLKAQFNRKTKFTCSDHLGSLDLQDSRYDAGDGRVGAEI